MDKMQVEMWPVERLKIYVKNPRKNDAVVPRMVEALREFGFRIPVIACSDGTLVDGHLRLKAAIHLGMREIPVLLADGLSEEQIRAFRVAVNRSATWADWDNELLLQELQDLQNMNYDIHFTGFDDSELEKMMSNILRDKYSGADDNYIPEFNPEPVTRICDVWLMGNHRLMCGDSTNGDHVAILMGGDMADMWLTDPPYNVGYVGGTKNSLTIKNDTMDDSSFRSFLESAFRAADAAMKPGAAFYVWHADSEGFNFRSAARAVGWDVRQCLIWCKSRFVLGRQDYQWQHEPCLYGWKSGAAHTWHGGRRQSTVLEFETPTRNAAYPTMKPVSLFEYLIQNSTDSDGIIFDSFGGSGTTIIAAEKQMRSARVMELDTCYCDMIVRRWQEYTGENAILESERRTFASCAERNR